MGKTSDKKEIDEVMSIIEFINSYKFIQITQQLLKGQVNVNLEHMRKILYTQINVGLMLAKLDYASLSTNQLLTLIKVMHPTKFHDERVNLMRVIMNKDFSNFSHEAMLDIINLAKT